MVTSRLAVVGCMATRGRLNLLPTTTSVVVIPESDVYEYLVRPPDVHIGGLISYDGFFLLSFFNFCQLHSALAEWNQPKLDTCSELSAI